MQFIMGVLNNKIVFKNNKKDVVIGQIEKNTSAIQDDHDRLLRLNMLSLTLEQVEQLKKQIEECQDQIKFWTSTTPKDQFISDLSEI
jgi:hypothetical protein